MNKNTENGQPPEESKYGGTPQAIYGHCLSYQQASQPLNEAVQRQSGHSGDKRKKGVYSRSLYVTTGILEEAVTGRLASTPMPASIVEELTKLRTATSH